MLLAASSTLTNHHPLTLPVQAFSSRPDLKYFRYSRTVSPRRHVNSDQRRPTSSSIFSTQNDRGGDDNTTDTQATTSLLLPSLMVAAPFLSAIFPALLSLAKSLPENSTQQFAVIAALFASNRLYLYGLSTTVLALAGKRASESDDSRLGERLVDLTEELLYSPDLNTGKKRENEENVEGEPQQRSSSPAMIQAMSSELGESMNEVSSETQAIVIPLLVSALLASSVLFLQIFNGSDSTLFQTLATERGAPAFDLTEYLPLLSKVWTGAVVAAFVRCEIRRLFHEFKVSTNDYVPWTAALVATSLAYGGIWQAQNFVNMSLAGLVARAIQLSRFPAIVTALVLLMFYDAASVFLIKPAVAAVIDDSSSLATNIASAAFPLPTIDLSEATTASASASAMGAVAMNKLNSAQFQPGILTTKIGSSLGGALGLGDAVFPSILSTFTKRFDEHITKSNYNDSPKENNDRKSLFTASIAGYIVGCLSCELLPFISSTGVPALIFIVPSMLLSVLAVAVEQEELESLWTFDSETADSHAQ